MPKNMYHCKRSYHSSNHGSYDHRNYYHPHHHATPEPYDVPFRAEGATRPNRIAFDEIFADRKISGNHRGRQQDIDTNILLL